MTEKWDAEWAEAKRRCRLSAADVKMAKELGLRPHSLLKNIPSPRESWKTPVREWVRKLYRERHAKMVPRGPKGRPRDAFESDTCDLPAGRWGAEVEEENARLLGRQEELRLAAEYVAAAFARMKEVQRIALFGSVAVPLRKEVPRLRQFRRSGVTLWHECKDLDIAVWLADCGSLHALTRARGRAVNELFDETGIGVAHHQVDVFIMEAGTDRYLGRLCTFGTCPKGKPECLVPGCGAAPFLRQHADFVFDPASLAPERVVTLFDRARSLGPPARRVDDDVPF